MGSGASKKKGVQDQVHVAATATSQPVAVTSAESEETTQEPSTPIPHKPEDSRETKRPQRSTAKKGSKQASTDNLGNSDVTPGPSPSPLQSPSPSVDGSKTASLPEAPPLPASSPPQQRKLEEDESDDEDVKAGAKAAARNQPVQMKPSPPKVARETSPSPKPVAIEKPPQSPVAVGKVVKPEELIVACREGDVATVEAFLVGSQKAKKSLAENEEALFDAYGDSVLHHAVHGASEHIVKSLLDKGGVQADIPNARNETALQIACRKGHTKIVAILLRAQADPDRKDSIGLTPFLSAVFAGGGNDTLELLVQATANVSAQDARGISSLHFASLRGDTTLLSWLLKHDANTDLQTEHGTTPIMLAARKGHIDSIVLLLEGKANTTLTDEAGCTALMHALSAAQSDVAKKILENSGTAIESVDSAGRSALFHAVLGGRVDGILAVIQRGGRVNVLDEEGRSPLYQSCLMGEKALVQCLLDADADPNLAGRGSTVRPAVAPGQEDEDEREADAARACLEESRTCLQVCAALAHNDLMGGLLEHGADINAAPGALGWTALHLCAAVANDEGAALLLSRGAVTSLHDAEGNTAAVLAERAGHQTVLEKLREAAASEPKEEQGVERKSSLRGALPPIGSQPEADPPEEEQEPLALFQEEWEERASDGSLLDRVCGPMVRDALQSDQWKIRLEAMTYLSKRYSQIQGSPDDIVKAICELVILGARDKVSKVFLAALALMEEMLSDARADALSPDAFTTILQARTPPLGQEAKEVVSQDVIQLLIDQTDAGGGSDARQCSTQQSAVDTLCNCILHGRVPLDDVAFPLLERIHRRMMREAGRGKNKDKKDVALGPKCLVANLKLLGRWLSTFGLQQSGVFRRALLLPYLMRGIASEHSKVRSIAIDVLIQLVNLSGGIEERIWNLLDAKKFKAVQRHASAQECTNLMSAVACEEDAMPKSTIVSEDPRIEAFTCVSELTPQLWASLLAGDTTAQTPCHSKAQAAKAMMAAVANSSGFGDENAAETMQKAFQSKNWKERAESVAALTSELSSCGDGVQLVEDASGMTDTANSGNSSGGPLLSQYILRGHRLHLLQECMHLLLSDKVTAVFVASADLLRLTCGRMPLYIAPLFLEPILPALATRLLDTSKKVQAKAAETTLEVASMHGCALSEMIVQCVASGSAWSSAPNPQSNGQPNNGRDCERSTGPRLQLLLQLMQQAQTQGCLGSWTDDTWKALGDYAMKAAEHRNGDVRKDAAGILNGMHEIGDRAGLAAERAVKQLQDLAAQRMGRRPGTSSTRPGTSSTLLSSSLTRPPSSFGLSGRLSNMSGTSRLTTGSRLGTGCSGRINTSRPKSGKLAEKEQKAEESDNSVHSDDGRDENGDKATTTEEDGIAFMDVQTACPGPDEVLELADGEAALNEALPLAEALDEVALDFVAPLIALFGDGWTKCFYSRHWQCRVAALMHLSASMSHRLEEINTPEMAPPALGELLDGSMRAVHEGLGDQNVRVYAEACRAVTAVVPAFCGVVDGRLLVAHLAPLLRQLCARMGDSKEVVRTQTTQSLFRLLRPPTGNIVSPVALAMLILRHLMPQRDIRDEGEATSSKPNAAANKGAATGWLCRLASLRDLVKEYHKTMVMQPGATDPGEWLRLKDGLRHSDPTVRHESARLYTLVCKMHTRSIGDDDAQRPAREAWSGALPKDIPSKSLAEVRKLLRLPEKPPSTLQAVVTAEKQSSAGRLQQPWEVPSSLAIWAGCPLEVLAALKSPLAGDEKAILTSFKILGKAASNQEEAGRRGGAKADEAFAEICRAIQQVLGSDVGADRRIFLSTIDLCQSAITGLSPLISGLDVNMGLGKTFPTLLDRTSLTADVKIAVASDKLVQQLAKHPKVGCEAVTKMVISAVARADRPQRPLVLLRTLLGDFGLRLCAQRDVVSLLLGAVATQLERASNNTSDPDGGEDHEAMRTQLVSVLATCNQFSGETVHFCMGEQEPTQRKLLMGALQAAPNPKLVALGASAAEQESMAMVGHLAGSAVRAASRGRDGREFSPVPSNREMSPRRPPPGPMHNAEPGTAERMRRTEGMRRSNNSLPRAQDGQSLPSASPPDHKKSRRQAEGSPGARRRRNLSPAPGNETGTSQFSEASTTASADPYSPDVGQSRRFPLSSSSSSSRLAGGPDRPPAPMQMSTVLNNGRDQWRFKEGDGDVDEQWRSLARTGSAEGRFNKKENGDSLAALMDVLSQMPQR